MKTPPKSYGRARRLRRRLTPPETRLWLRLKSQPHGVKFRRQHPLGVYILDFYCLEAALAVEVDGRGHDHPDQLDHDEARDARLTAEGLETLRFTAAEAMADPDDAADRALQRALQRLLRG